MLKIHNPATGELIAEVPEANEALVAERAQAARRAQPAWAALPLAHRIGVIQRFRAGLEEIGRAHV